MINRFLYYDFILLKLLFAHNQYKGITNSWHIIRIESQILMRPFSSKRTLLDTLYWPQMVTRLRKLESIFHPPLQEFLSDLSYLFWHIQDSTHKLEALSSQLPHSWQELNAKCWFLAWKLHIPILAILFLENYCQSLLVQILEPTWQYHPLWSLFYATFA